MTSLPPPPSSISISPSKNSTDKDTKTRSYVLYSFWLVVLLSLPYFWISTSIQRLPLPPLETSVSDRLRSLRFRDEVILSIASGQADGELDLGEVSNRVNEHLQQRSDAHSCEEIAVRAAASSSISASLFHSHEIQISLLPSTTPSAPITSSFVPSTHKSPSPILRITLPSSSLPELPQYIINSLSSFLPPTAVLMQLDDSASSSRAAKFAPHYRLAFTLLLEDVTDSSGGQVGWEIERGLDLIFKPYLSSLSSLHNFTLESQIHYSSPLSITPLPSPDNSSSWIVPHSSTKAFLNPSAWTLGSHSTLDTASSPTLQFMIFVPKKGRRPLSFELADGEGQQQSSGRVGGSLLIPQSGSLTLYNPENEEGGNDPEYLSLNRLAPLLRTHLQNLQILLGVPSSPYLSTPHSVSSAADGLRSMSDVGLTSFQMAALLKRRTLENFNSALGGVEALGRLVKQNGEMRIGEKVQRDYLEAVEHLKQIVDQPTIDPFNAFRHSAAALELSSEAFFNPSMLGLLYFPDEHKYAVYTPLFAPIAVPMIVGLVKEIKRRSKERKEKEKTRKLTLKEERKGSVLSEVAAEGEAKIDS